MTDCEAQRRLGTVAGAGERAFRVHIRLAASNLDEGTRLAVALVTPRDLRCSDENRGEERYGCGRKRPGGHGISNH